MSVTIETFRAFCEELWTRYARGGNAAAYAIDGWFEDAERHDAAAAARVEDQARTEGLLS